MSAWIDAPDTVPVSSVVSRADFQVRTQTNPKVVSRYTADLLRGATMPPITCYRIDGVLYVVDGFHRLAAHIAAGHRDIPANVIDGTVDDAKGFAATANLDHGVPLKPKDIRKALRLSIEAGKHKVGRRLLSYRDLANEFGNRVSYGTIRNWIEKDFPALFQKMGGGPSHEGGERQPPSPLPTMSKVSLCQMKVKEVLAIAQTMLRREQQAIAELLLQAASTTESGQFEDHEETHDEDF